MRTILLVVCMAILCACSSAPTRSLEEALPKQIAGWTLSSTAQLERSSVPPVVEQLGMSRAILATYSGPAPVTVRVFEMNMPTSAFELIQKWRQQDGLAVYTGPYFIVADPAATGAAPLLEGLRRDMQ
jgi:hypothetical protein